MPSKISKWLSLCNPLSSELTEELIGWMYSSTNLIEDIEEIFEKLSSNTVSDTCQRLFVFYKSGDVNLQTFTILLLPSLLYAYLSHSYEDNVLFQTRKGGSNFSDIFQSSHFSGFISLESCLIGICSHYLLTTAKTDAEHLIDFRKFCLPSLNPPSVFHDPVLYKETIDRVDINSKDQIDYAQSKRIPALICLIQNYIDILSISDLFHPFSTFLTFHSLERFNKLCDRICGLSTYPRIPTSSTLLITLINCCDLILFKLDSTVMKYPNNVNTIRLSVLNTIEEINKRASYHCFTSCILMCQSLLHFRTIKYGSQSLISRPSHIVSGLLSKEKLSTRNSLIMNNKDDSLLGSTSNQLPLSPTTEVFTNASFRSETLSEDILPCDKSLHVKDNLEKDESSNNSVNDVGENDKSKTNAVSSSNIPGFQLGVDYRMRNIELQRTHSNTNATLRSQSDIH